LVVQTGAQSELNRGTALDTANRNQKASVQFEVVGRDRIDLLRGVSTADETLRAPPITLTTNDEHFPSPSRPLALDSQKAGLEVEDHVAAAALGNRTVNINSELDRFRGDRDLRDRSFLIRCHKRQPTDRIGWAVSI
jgi:hypothetical protein